ncbi:unnamed protein product [Cyprideis torosa]|uniref:FERM central domain-containing protein n=1 Tax=Cyprideis torosa TaxID=163714 RepID=A0A7R8ZGJ1_9CRUS|nr:unnamed protein product [Cyprideis torosa]CAG0881764.1 unnamed protein product [Cyprideis torosa]
MVRYSKLSSVAPSLAASESNNTTRADARNLQSIRFHDGVIEVGDDLLFRLAALVIQATAGDFVCDTTTKVLVLRSNFLPDRILQEYQESECVERVAEEYRRIPGLARGEAVVNPSIPGRLK